MVTRAITKLRSGSGENRATRSDMQSMCTQEAQPLERMLRAEPLALIFE